MKKLFLLSTMALVMLASCEKNNPSTSVKDTCGNTYKIVTISGQTWMAENMKCDKYDTDSEAYKAGLKTISTSSTSVYTPYYIDATKKPWTSEEYFATMSDEQIAKLGYLYNWAATVGLTDGKSQTAVFTGNRQGICPNGWHVPTGDELNTLIATVGGKEVAAKNLKTTSGWNNGGNGTDKYGFGVLPAGHAVGNTILTVGKENYIWSSTPNGDYDWTANDKAFNSTYDEIFDDYTDKKYGIAVRCLKN